MSRARELADLSNVINKGANLQPNLIINSDMAVNQRGDSTSASSGGYHACDRYSIRQSGSYLNNLTFDAVQSTEAPDGFNYSYKLKNLASDTPTGNEYGAIRYNVEDKDIDFLEWGTSNATKSLTLQFWVKASVAGTYSISIESADSTYAYVHDYTINTADTWQKITHTIPPTTSGGFSSSGTGLKIYWAVAGASGGTNSTSTINSWVNSSARYSDNQVNLTASANNEFYLTGVSLVVGDTAPVTHPYESYAENLERCQRYYYNFLTLGKQYQNIGIATLYTALVCYTDIAFPVQMRTEPSLGVVNTQIELYTNSSAQTVSSLTGDYGSVNNKRVNAPFSVSKTGGHSGFLFSSSTSDKLYFDAEL